MTLDIAIQAAAVHFLYTIACLQTWNWRFVSQAIDKVGVSDRHELGSLAVNFLKPPSYCWCLRGSVFFTCLVDAKSIPSSYKRSSRTLKLFNFYSQIIESKPVYIDVEVIEPSASASSASAESQMFTSMFDDDLLPAGSVVIVDEARTRQLKEEAQRVSFWLKLKTNCCPPPSEAIFSWPFRAFLQKSFCSVSTSFNPDFRSLWLTLTLSFKFIRSARDWRLKSSTVSSTDAASRKSPKLSRHKFVSVTTTTTKKKSMKWKEFSTVPFVRHCFQGWLTFYPSAN